jgi:hypothetical protein
MAYGSLTRSIEITGSELALQGLSSGFGINAQLQWASNLNKTITFGGNFNIPDILKGTMVVQVIVPPTGYPENKALTSLSEILPSGGLDIGIQGVRYLNTFYTGGQIGTREFGEGQKSITISKVFSVFGECVTATA